MRITASWLLLLVKVLKVSESASLPKQAGGRPSTLASVLWGLREGAWGTGPPSLLQHLLPRGLLEPCRRNAWPLSELPAPPGNTDSPVRSRPSPVREQTLQGLSWGCKDEQRSDPETFKRQISARFCLRVDFTSTQKTNPGKGPEKKGLLHVPEHRKETDGVESTLEPGARGLTTGGGLCVGEKRPPREGFPQGSTDGLSIGPTRWHQSQMQHDQALGRSDLEMVTVGTEGATGRRIKRFREEWRRGDRDRWMNKKPPHLPMLTLGDWMIVSRTQRRMRNDSAS